MKKTICLLFFKGLLLTAIAQQSNGRLSFQQHTVADRPTDNSFLCIFRDPIGYIWVGTLNGLLKDGGNRLSAFKYNPPDPYSLEAGIVSFGYEDRKGDTRIGASAIF